MKIAIITAILLVVAASVMAVVTQRKDSADFSAGTDTGAGTSTPQATVRVSPIHSNVFVSNLGSGADASFTEIKTEATSTTNARIKTSSTGRALVEGRHTSVIGSDTEIVLASLDVDGSQSRISLEAGDIWSRVEKLSDKGEFYEIETKNAVAVVHGTSFGVSYHGSTTILIVTDGTVGFRKRALTVGGGTGGGTTTTKTVEVIVTAGEKAVVSGVGEVDEISDIKVGPIISSDMGAWFISNNPTYQRGQPTKQQPKQPTESSMQAPSEPTSSPTPSSGTAPEAIEISLDSVSPAEIESSTKTALTLAGVGLKNARSVRVNGKPVEYQIVSDKVITLSVNLPEGVYDIAVYDLQISARLDDALTVRAEKQPEPEPEPATQTVPQSEPQTQTAPQTQSNPQYPQYYFQPNYSY